MEFEKIIELIQAVSDSSLTQFGMEEGNLKLSMKTDKASKGVPIILEQAQGLPVQAAPAQAAARSGAADEGEEPSYGGNLVKAPLVGTFYESSSPDNPAFVQVGDAVKKGQTLGIVEAMKLMNEIESEFDGTVTEILVENQQVVEYGQPLFVIQ